MILKNTFSIAALSFAAAMLTPVFAQESGFDKKVNLWAEGTMPANGEAAAKALAFEKEKSEKLKLDKNLKDSRGRALRSFFIETPYYQLSIPADAKNCGLVVVSPGGAYNFLAADHEGKQIVEWLNKNGIAAMMVMYRVPENPMGALQDIQRAIRTARANAKAWNINPDKIGVIGFSAGANLSSRASTLYDEKVYQAIDATDKFSAKPNATILVYPAYCDERGYNSRWRKEQSKDTSYNGLYALAPELKIDKNTPPAFIIQSQDDKSYINAAFAYYLALKDANVPACLHIFDKGGHGYGLSKNRKNKDGTKFLPSAWGDLAIDWLKSNGFSSEK